MPATKNLFNPRYKMIIGTSDIAVVEQKPVLEGKNMSMILAPKKEIIKSKGV